MRNILAVSFFALLLSSQAFAQTKAQPNSGYDAELAKRVGADKIGMRKYVVAFIKTGPHDSEVKGDQRKAVFKGHFDNMSRLSKDGKLVVAGPFNDPQKIYRGLWVFAVSTVDEARPLAESDPAVKAGVFVVELIPWYGSAGLMLGSEIHEKIYEKPAQ